MSAKQRQQLMRRAEYWHKRLSNSPTKYTALDDVEYADLKGTLLGLVELARQEDRANADQQLARARALIAQAEGLE